MSRKTAIIEEEFDDDTDLPLPSQPLPNLGTYGPLLEEIQPSSQSHSNFHSSQQSFIDSRATRIPNRGPATTPTTDITSYKTWTCIYPIYFDAKRPYGTGQRRVERAKSVWWPLSRDINDAAQRLGFSTLHEVQKSHPRDWENPGRVRVQWKTDDRLINPVIQTKKQLLEMIALQMQLLKPEIVARPPYNLAGRTELLATETVASTSTLVPSNKGKQSSTSKSKSPAAATTATARQNKQINGRRLPVPPEPFPPLSNRVSLYSPAIPTGVLIETVKAGMNAMDGNAVGTGGSGSGGAQKGKRKVVRVRG